MKSNNIKRLFHSLPVRLSLLFCVILLVGCLSLTSLIAKITYDHMYDEAKERTALTMNGIVNRIDFYRQQAQNESLNVTSQVSHYISDKNSHKSLEKITHYFCTENDWAITTKICFLPGKRPKTSDYTFFISYLDSLGTISDIMSNDTSDFMDRYWYKNAVEKKVPTWSEPFYNHTNHKIVNTFSCPIFDENTHEMIGIWAVDIEFADLDQLMKNWQPYPNAYGFIVSNEGRIISHPDPDIEMALCKELSDEYRTDSNKRIYELLMSKEEGVEELVVDGEPCLIFYSPIKAGASIVIICPFRDVFAEIYALRNLIWQNLLVVFIISTCLIFFLVKRFTKPMNGLVMSVRAMAQGNFNAKIPVIKSKDEVREFRDVLFQMQQSLAQNISELTQTTATKARFENELFYARQIQKSLIPTDLSLATDAPQLQLSAKLKPAREIGGDMYDFFIKDGKLYFALGDVAGTGIPASLFMAITCKLYRLVTNHESSPTVIAQEINKTLSLQNTENMFVTVFLGVFDLQTGELNYVNAGHTPPVLLGKNGAKFIDIVSNVPFGAFEDATFVEQTLTLQQGEMLLIYTDGITEAENVEQELYGEERLLNFAQKNGQNSAQTVIKNLKKAVNDFANGAEQSDDITVLCFGLKELQEVENQVVTLYNDGGEEIVLQNNLEEIVRLQEFVEQTALKFDISVDKMMMLNLALEELVVNVISYGFPDGKSGEIRLSAAKTGEKIRFKLIDNGVPFDPTAVPDVDTTATAEQRDIGGLGILLARKIFTKIDYRRTQNQNCLDLEV